MTDDTYAINNATADGTRCGANCTSSTTVPAIVYFPPGTYIVSTPLIQYYYTQFIGDANDLPTIKATSDFFGIGIFDSDVYLSGGSNWYQNQNNFYRQIRNFVLDITAVPFTYGMHCIHWQVAQATSLQNIVMNMYEGTPGDGNAQLGIFMDNGSGGFLEDLIFNGGGTGFFSGNQQFTCRNLTFNNCNTAIFQNWNWVFAYKDIYINNCGTGLDTTQGGEIITTGSIVLQDAVFTNVANGIVTYFSSNSTPVSGGTLVIDNVDFINTPNALQYANGTTIIPGNQLVTAALQGQVYSAYESKQRIENLTCYEPTANNSRIQQVVGAPPKAPSLLTPTGTFVSRSRPQYEGVPVASFVSAKTFGLAGDGVTDDTLKMQEFLDSITTDQIAYFDHGAYVISSTIDIPININIVGEIWPMIMIDGSAEYFQNQDAPNPVFRVGSPGDVGQVQMSDLVFETIGPAPGAVVIEWNLAGSTPGETGMWDVHWRIGGSNGTLLQSTQCTKNPDYYLPANLTCVGSFLLMHITNTASLLMSNTWGWVADHELDIPGQAQIDIYNGRGVLIESQGPVWMYGTAFEHSMLYNYQIANAKDIYMSIIQSETA